MKTTHPIYDVYFRIEAGYNDGRMSHEQHDRFYTEIRALFSRAGFTILENPPGCPSFQLGTTCLYCHPTELSGPVEEPHIALVERVLRQGTSFQYQTTDRYDRLYDFTVEEELAYYRQHYSEQLFLEAFRTSGPVEIPPSGRGSRGAGAATDGAHRPRTAGLFVRFAVRALRPGDLHLAGPTGLAC